MVVALSLGLMCCTNWLPPAGDADFLYAKGSMQIKGKSTWHNIDIRVQAQENRQIETDLMQHLRPPKLQKNSVWHVDGKKLAAVADILHQIQWQANVVDQDAYFKWMGSGIKEKSLSATGKLKLKLTESKQGYRAALTGTVQVDDKGSLASRFGPNWWHKEWTHTLTGTVELDQRGNVVQVELTDTFRAKGGFFSGQPPVTDPCDQTGSVEVRVVAPKPLTVAEATAVEKLIRQLGSDRFQVRERASVQLLKMGPRIVRLLREAGLSSDDAEVRQRTRAILKKLGS